MKILTIPSKALLALFLGFSALTVSHADDALPYYNSAEFSPQWLEVDSPELANFHQVSTFSFTNQDGEIVSDKDFDNTIYVANFFFSTCPGICPMVRSKLIKIQDHYINDDDISILSHSIRPTNDTVEVLQAYAEENGVISGKWHLVTGKRDAIYDLARNAYFADEDLGEDQGLEDFLHTENILLIDQNKHIRGIYNGLNNASMANLITDIAILKKTLER